MKFPFGLFEIDDSIAMISNIVSDETVRSQFEDNR